MSKKKVTAAMEELLDWLPNMNRKSIDAMVKMIAEPLAGLPGGDELEDVGYEPIAGIGWKEFELCVNVLAAVDDKSDVEQVAEMLLRSDDDDEEDSAEENPLSAKDIREFRGFLKNASDRQVQGIYDKEMSAGREEYAELAVAEAETRGIDLELHDEDAEEDEDDDE